MLHNFCEVATDFPAHLRQLKDPLRLRASEAVVQFPFIPPIIEEKTEEELSRIAEKRKEQGRKLQEMAAKTREEKVCASSSPFTITDLVIAFAKRNRITPSLGPESKGNGVLGVYLKISFKYSNSFSTC